jgi:hypothetical protein
LAAYSPLIPDVKDLKVTFMLEFPDEAEHKVRLNPLIGIKELISIQTNGFDPVYPIANEDLARSNDEKTSAVHFLRFEFTDDMIAAAENGASWVLRCEHQNYQHSYDSLPAEVSNSLAYDFA